LFTDARRTRSQKGRATPSPSSTSADIWSQRCAWKAKATAVAAWGFSTAQMERSAKETPGFANAPHVVTVPGGVPVWSADGKTRLGGVGVSGEAPADDAACAEAGIRAAGLRSSRG
jgi:uncharacterized protein GlcG (DUF336 family)